MNELEKRNRMVAEFIESLGDEQLTAAQTSFMLNMGGSTDGINGGTNERDCQNDSLSCMNSTNKGDCFNSKGYCDGDNLYNGGKCINTGTLQPPSYNLETNCGPICS